MKHLIPYLQDDQKAADYLRQLRWPDGIKCPRCGSDAAEPRERCDNGLQRFNCLACAVRLGQQFAMFTDWTSSIFEESKLRPLEWLLVMGLWQLKLNATEIAAAADIQERTAQRCINVLDGASTRRTIWTRHANERTKWKRMSATRVRAAKGWPVKSHAANVNLDNAGFSFAVEPPPRWVVHPCWAWCNAVTRPTGRARCASHLEVLEHVRTATIKPIIAAKVKVGAQFFTDEYNIYHFTKADYDHRTVNHGAGEYARRDPDGTGVHCNTMEGLWSSLRNFLDRFRVSANASCTSESRATSSCTTMDTCTGVRLSKQPCGPFSRPRAIIGGGWPINIAVCR